MDHGGMDHGDMDMGPMCSMNMLFTWDTTNLCIIFRSWRVAGTTSLLLSLLAVAALTAGYELVRESSRQYEAHQQRIIDEASRDQESSSLLWPGRNAKAAEQQGRLVKAVLYAVQVFYSFFIMLLFMTYNGWIMLAVAVGAFFGYLLFSGSGSATKSVACH